jgi:hypothetical protein
MHTHMVFGVVSIKNNPYPFPFISHSLNTRDSVVNFFHSFQRGSLQA